MIFAFVIVYGFFRRGDFDLMGFLYSDIRMFVASIGADFMLILLVCSIVYIELLIA